ncbi:MAG: peptidoglycan-binding protein [Myxococcales bacterium]|nr:peptidoglycan-binding protein [Myxococcales bacterium]
MPYQTQSAKSSAPAPALKEMPEKAAPKAKKSPTAGGYAEGKATVAPKAAAAAPKTNAGKLTPAQVAQAVEWYNEHPLGPKLSKKIQKKVDVVADGWIGPVTVKAIAAWQAEHGLYVDGIAGPVTLGAMFGKPATKPPTKPPGADSAASAFNKTPPKSDYTIVWFRGVKMNARTKEMVLRAETILQSDFGHKDFKFEFSQGSYNESVSASAGTHAGGGALDIRTVGKTTKTVDHMVKALRTAGFAAWSRGRGHDSLPPHIHAIAIGDKKASWQAQQQVIEYAKGGDGLIGTKPDPDYDVAGKPIPAWALPYVKAYL